MSYNPIYYLSIVTGENKKYDVTEALTDLNLIENDGEIAQRVNFSLVNVKAQGRYLSDIFSIRNRVYVYAEAQGKKDEVFRGYIWNAVDTSSDGRELSYIAYDNLIYFQKSQEYVFEPSGSDTKTIAGKLCSNWGVKLFYNYRSITHGKLALRGNLADIFLSDLIDEVRKKTGIKGVMRSEKDNVYINPVGYNTQVYELKAGDGGTAIQTRKETEMPEVTKIIILGKENDDKRSEIVSTLSGDIASYGTLQQIEYEPSDTDISKTKDEANATLKDKGKPKRTYTYNGIDVPFIRKGDRVKISSDNMSDLYIVTSILHDGKTKKMDIDLEDV